MMIIRNKTTDDDEDDGTGGKYSIKTAIELRHVISNNVAF